MTPLPAGAQYAALPQGSNRWVRVMAFSALGVVALLIVLIAVFVWSLRDKPNDKLEYSEIQYCLTSPPKNDLRELYACLEQYSTSAKIQEIKQSSLLAKGGRGAVQDFVSEHRQEPYGHWSWVQRNPASKKSEVDPTSVVDVLMVFADEGTGPGLWGESSPRRGWYILVGTNDEILGWFAYGN